MASLWWREEGIFKRGLRCFDYGIRGLRVGSAKVFEVGEGEVENPIGGGALASSGQPKWIPLLIEASFVEDGNAVTVLREDDIGSIVGPPSLLASETILRISVRYPEFPSAVAAWADENLRMGLIETEEVGANGFRSMMHQWWDLNREYVISGRYDRVGAGRDLRMGFEEVVAAPSESQEMSSSDGTAATLVKEATEAEHAFADRITIALVIALSCGLLAWGILTWLRERNRDYGEPCKWALRVS
jgi:hypothetical protein